MIKRLATISNAFYIELITAAVVTGFFSVIKFNRGSDLREWDALFDVIILISLATNASRTSDYLFAVNKKNTIKCFLIKVANNTQNVS